MMYPINSEEYWENRYSSGDWEVNKGREQTAYFYRLLLRMMPQWAKNDILQKKYDLVDFGCAEGQGVPILAAQLGTNIKGVDFSSQAISYASQSYPDFTFEVADVWKYDQHHDVAVLSNIIEHFDQPFAVLKRISSITRKYMIVMVPLEEVNLMPEHKFSFFYNNIPTAIDDFRLIFFSEYDCREDEEQLFLGKQIFLLYSTDNEICQTLSIEASNGLTQLFAAQDAEKKQFERILSAIENRVAQSETRVESWISQSESQLEKSILSLAQSVDNLNAEQKQSQADSSIDQSGTQIEENLRLLKQSIDKQMEYIAQNSNDVNGKYVELVNRFNSLNDTYGEVVNENFQIKNSRTYKFAKLLWKIANKLHLIGFVQLLLTARHTGIRQAVKQRKIQKKATQKSVIEQSTLSGISELGTCEDAQENEQIEAFRYRKAFYKTVLEGGMTETARKIAEIIAQRPHKGIVVYPHAVHWEPMQRPQHFLRAFAEEGYLCFFCEAPSDHGTVEEKYDNVFVVYGEENLLTPLQNQCPIVLCTFHIQIPFVDSLPQKIIWFDVLDKLDFFAGGSSNLANTIYKKLIQDADIVSYSADNLKKYLAERNDAIKLNNGVMLSDFDGIEKATKINVMEKIKAKGLPIIGYYGAIEAWFDKGAIRALLEKTDYEIVLIGRCGIDLNDLSNNRLHVLGMIPYKDLADYAKYFDLALIPFVKNELTDAVSPVKFYEYVAQGLPVLSSDIQEMRQYATDQVCIYHDEEELIALAKSLCEQSANKASLREIALQNTWTKRAESVLNELFATPRGLQTIADFHSANGVAVETVTFFKYDGSVYYSGGAERYLLDLHEICDELKVPYRIYQYGEYNWVRYYNNVEVVGMRARENNVNVYNVPLVNEMDQNFLRETSPNGKLNIYSPFYILGKKGDVPSVGISHGISWDSEYNHFTDGNTFWQINKNIIDSASSCDMMISVDTNTSNWFQTLDYDTGRKIHYIPNYVDNREFAPREDYLSQREKVVITYPRRLYGARGLYVVLDVIDDILQRYDNVEFHFVGKGFNQDTKHVEKKIEKWGERVKWYSKAPNEMHEVYKQSDISLIPTMYSEGTSLSCLEALSSGNVVIATRVGGLTDLILSDYNGKLVEPNGESIKEALYDLLDHPEKMQMLKKNAVETAQAFSKEKWKKEWKKIISAFVSEGNNHLETGRCLIRLQSDAELNKPCTLQLIREYLEAGWCVYVACKKNPMRYDSYKRLQFIDWDEDLYFTPEKTIQL